MRRNIRSNKPQSTIDMSNDVAIIQAYGHTLASEEDMPHGHTMRPRKYTFSKDAALTLWISSIIRSHCTLLIDYTKVVNQVTFKRPKSNLISTFLVEVDGVSL